jgi:hypothetical protein
MVFKLTFTMSRWALAYPYREGRRRRALVSRSNYLREKATLWEDFELGIVLPRQGATLFGRPRVKPFLSGRGSGVVTNSTHILWPNVPMAVQPTTNYSRVFSFAVKVDKGFRGQKLTFTAVAQGPPPLWRRHAVVVVPVQAQTK